MNNRKAPYKARENRRLVVGSWGGAAILLFMAIGVAGIQAGFLALGFLGLLIASALTGVLLTWEFMSR